MRKVVLEDKSVRGASEKRRKVAAAGTSASIIDPFTVSMLQQRGAVSRVTLALLIESMGETDAEYPALFLRVHKCMANRIEVEAKRMFAAEGIGIPWRVNHHFAFVPTFAAFTLSALKEAHVRCLENASQLVSKSLSSPKELARGASASFDAEMCSTNLRAIWTQHAHALPDLESVPVLSATFDQDKSGASARTTLALSSGVTKGILAYLWDRDLLQSIACVNRGWYLYLFCNLFVVAGKVHNDDVQDDQCARRWRRLSDSNQISAMSRLEMKTVMCHAVPAARLSRLCELTLTDCSLFSRRNLQSLFADHAAIKRINLIVNDIMLWHSVPLLADRGLETLAVVVTDHQLLDGGVDWDMLFNAFEFKFKKPPARTCVVIAIDAVDDAAELNRATLEELKTGSLECHTHIFGRQGRFEIVFAHKALDEELVADAQFQDELDELSSRIVSLQLPKGISFRVVKSDLSHSALCELV
jgi:hypothetical protein